MPALVEFRLGSIFDEACDLLVIPSSTGGTVTPGVQEQIRKAGLPFPSAMPWSTVAVCESPNPLFGAIAYAAAVSGQASSPAIIEGIGRELGKIADTRRIKRIATPLLGAGAGDLPQGVAADALTRGFLQTAPNTAQLVINVRGPHVFLPDGSPPWTPDDSLSTQDASKADKTAHPEQHQQDPAPSRTAEPSKPTAPERTVPAPAVPRTQRSRVFVSYSHADAEWLERLQKHLRPLERAGIDVWDDTRLRPGEPWREEIREALAGTRVAILLVSADFLASDFIVTDELPPLLQAAAEHGATILPVIISPCRFGRMESLSRFQAVNDPDKPLVQLRRANREKVLDQVARAVEDALQR